MKPEHKALIMTLSIIGLFIIAMISAVIYSEYLLWVVLGSAALFILYAVSDTIYHEFLDYFKSK